VILLKELTTAIGKKRTYFVGMAPFIPSLISLYFADDVEIPAIYFLAVCAGIGVATAFLIPWSMLPDVCDYEYLRTGERREGDLYAIFGLVQKVAVGIALSLSSYILDLVGYVNPSDEDEAPEQPRAVRRDR
jgi:GPH family glycoside/pentoside/hexuronide:cation symporter